MQFRNFSFRQRQFLRCSLMRTSRSRMLRAISALPQRVHLVGATLVDVQFRDLIPDPALSARLPLPLSRHHRHAAHLADQSDSYKTGCGSHWRDIDNLYAITVKMVTHKTSKQVLQGMDPSFWHHFVRHAEAQIEHGDCVAMRGCSLFFATRTAGASIRVDRL